MKRMHIAVLPLLLAPVLAFTSCRTMVKLKVLIPAQVNMKDYRTVAVESTRPFTGGQWMPAVRMSGFEGGIWNVIRFNDTAGLAEKIRRKAQKNLVDTLVQSGYFTKVIAPEVTDTITGPYAFNTVPPAQILQSNGINALVRSHISDLSCDQWVEEVKIYEIERYTDKDGKKQTRKKFDHYEYKLHTNVTVDFTYVVIDSTTGAIVATNTITDKNSHTKTFRNRFSMAPDPWEIYDGLLDNQKVQITRHLTPHWETFNAEVMSNKPKSSEAEAAYKLLKNGNYAAAQQMFYNIWQVQHHVPSGYNAALCAQGCGNNPDAVAIISEVMQFAPGDPMVVALYNRLKLYEANASAARAQM